MAAWTCTSQVSVESSTKQRFWDAAKVLVERPHTLNRRLMGSHVLSAYRLKALDNLDQLGISPLVLGKLHHMWEESHSPTLELDTGTWIRVNSKTVWCLEDLNENILLFIKLLPKQPEKFKALNQAVLLDKRNTCITFHLIHSPNNVTLVPEFSYRLHSTENNCICLDIVDSVHLMKNPSMKWLQNCILPKVAKWMMIEKPTSGQMSSIPSLQLVPVECYCNTYSRLKTKYGQRLVKIWPESTDPLKFVYEDIAIAAYLLVFWEMERRKHQLKTKQSFVDLGCGNGLLVYILTCEGHSGIGIDIRKRAIWDMFGPETCLQERAVIPSDDMLFPDYDWLIGNHSDEMTPWIPVVAARSSPTMGCFLLPCCAYTFDGKYQRVHAGCSLYQSYLQFLKELCTAMGFCVQQDKLRIPSTKRVCLICSGRNYAAAEAEIVDERRTQFILSHSTQKRSTVAQAEMHNAVHLDNSWSRQFQPREPTERVRNCTQLDRNFLDAAVTTLATVILKSGDEHCNILDSHGCSMKWKLGGSLTLKELVDHLEVATLKELKHQCGGVQTLLRNHRHIFKVQEGMVSLRCPAVTTPVLCPPRKRPHIRKVPHCEVKSRPCWFYLHHPQGCPLNAEICRFKHSQDVT